MTNPPRYRAGAIVNMSPRVDATVVEQRNQLAVEVMLADAKQAIASISSMTPGPPGPQGPPGEASRWWTGHGPPTAALPANDLYLDVDTGDIWSFISNAAFILRQSPYQANKPGVTAALI